MTEQLSGRASRYLSLAQLRLEMADEVSGRGGHHVCTGLEQQGGKGTGIRTA